VKSKVILLRECRCGNRERILEYLAAIAGSCLDVANNPSPRMLATISGVLRLVPKTISEICEERP